MSHFLYPSLSTLLFVPLPTKTCPYNFSSKANILSISRGNSIARNGNRPSKNQSNIIRTMAGNLPNWRGKGENKEEPMKAYGHLIEPISLRPLSGNKKNTI